MKFKYSSPQICDMTIHDKMLECLLITCTRSIDIEVGVNSADGTIIYFRDSDGNYRQVIINDYNPTSTSKEYLHKLAKEFMHKVDEL